MACVCVSVSLHNRSSRWQVKSKSPKRKSKKKTRIIIPSEEKETKLKELLHHSSCVFDGNVTRATERMKWFIFVCCYISLCLTFCLAKKKNESEQQLINIECVAREKAQAKRFENLI